VGLSTLRLCWTFASRRVLADKVAITLEAIHAKEVIEQAFALYGVAEIINTV